MLVRDFKSKTSVHNFLLPYLFHFLRGHTARKASKYKGSWSLACDNNFDFGSMLPYSLQKLMGDNSKKTNVAKGLRGKSSPRIFVCPLIGSLFVSKIRVKNRSKPLCIFDFVSSATSRLVTK